ncbi:hypothetical protein NQ317_004796 [Molorchus minor]|uniref:Malic enzyme n=1 Tax=Molorchus minor TaxID=1323400 RepID=A0ABQ9JRA3_9CUCU|nr:hypothetical protein NQ317_004796 [Molorchus minor]
MCYIDLFIYISLSKIKWQKSLLSKILSIYKPKNLERHVCKLSRSRAKGEVYVEEPKLNKGLAFTLAERQHLGIHGFHPIVQRTQEEQMTFAKMLLERLQDPLSKPYPEIRAIVVTDGERILGLGDLGAHGMGIPIGKLSLCTALAGIKPENCLPITLDVGTNNQKLREDPLYVGLPQKRVTGQAYDDFIDEFMRAVVKSHYCTFNDDIQGTAGVVVSGLLASMRMTGKKLSENTFLFLGAGEAALGIADLVVKAMKREGTHRSEGRQKIWMMDVDGLLTLNRPEGGIDEHKRSYAKEHEPVKDLARVVNEIKPSVLIGAAAASGAFTPEIIKAMASFNERPVIFALSNPTPKAECTAMQAYTHTEGRVIFASGSPFGKVEYGGKTFYPGQGNNAYVYPGVALGILLSGIPYVAEQVFLIASDTVSSKVSDKDLEVGRVYPPLSAIKECSIDIACNIMEYAFDEHLITNNIPPGDMRKYVISNMYNVEYDSYLPPTWDWENKDNINRQTTKNTIRGLDLSRSGPSPSFSINSTAHLRGNHPLVLCSASSPSGRSG